MISAGGSPARLAARSGDAATCVGSWPCSNIEANVIEAGLEEIGRYRGCHEITMYIKFVILGAK